MYQVKGNFLFRNFVFLLYFVQEKAEKFNAAILAHVSSLSEHELLLG
jgi:hypothetical protein